MKPFDFAWFEALYDLRIVLEREAVRRLCGMPPGTCAEHLAPLIAFWVDAPPLEDGLAVSPHDEQFHTALVAATGNGEMTRVHVDLTEKIRIIRHLDFTRDDRVAATYQEHGRVLRAILTQQTEEAQRILTDHILQSKAVVRKITLHRLQQSRLSPVSSQI